MRSQPSRCSLTEAAFVNAEIQAAGGQRGSLWHEEVFGPENRLHCAVK